MSKILIIEDQLMIAESLSITLKELGHEVVDIACTLLEAKKQIVNLTFDLAFVDINLDDNNEGIELGKLLHKLSIPFIYLTSYYDNDTLELAKHTYPDSYIIKPATKKEIFTNLQIVLAKTDANKIKLKDGSKTYFVSIEDILWIKADSIYLEVQTKERLFIERKTFSEIMKLLNNDIFCQTHRSWVVNIKHINTISSNNIIINDKSIPVSRSCRGLLNDKIDKL